jgi:riboflavin kinase/FMN adenylyltransferase
VVVTFDPHPIRVLSPDNAPRLLTSHRHKMALLAAYGIEDVLVIRFDADFCHLSGADFVKKLHAASASLQTICVGSDWTFGHKRSGTVDLLRSMGSEMGFSVVGVPTVKVGGATASSTAIREAVERGDFQIAAAMLGRPYTVLGTVVEGRKLGREIGFPTANLKVHNEQLPPSGVYAVTVTQQGGGYHSDHEIPGVANLGKRPTVEEGSDVRRQLEVHLFEFDEEIYGEDIEIRFVRFLRGEQKFDGIDTLKAQIKRDAEAARQAILRLGP